MKSISFKRRVALVLVSCAFTATCDHSPAPSEPGAVPVLAAAGPVTQLVFTVQPATTQAGSSITAVQVSAEDAQGNVVTTFKGTVAIAIGTNPGTGTLGGTVSKKASSGVVTFSNLNIKVSGTGYTLVASSLGLTSGTSGPFDITPATASRLAFTVQPTSVAAGDPITPAVQVSVQDAYNNLVPTFGGTITLAKRSPCPTGTILSGTVTQTPINGVATFADLSLNKSGNCALQATSTGITAANSAGFVVGPAAPVGLGFFTASGQSTTTIGQATAGKPITAPNGTAIQVVARDRFGNRASGFTGPVTVTIATGPVGATLSGTTTVSAVLGLATFSDLVLTKIGTYSLQAAAAGLTAGTSNGFNVVANLPTHLVFTSQPLTTAPGAHITPAVDVTVRDAYDNPVKNVAGVTVAIGANPGGGTLAGTTTKSSNNVGVASFGNLSINKAGIGYTLVASAGILPTTTSAPFNIGAGGAPAQLAFAAQPSNTPTGAAITPAVQVTAQDAQGNTATTFSGPITLSIGSNPGAGTLSGTSTVSATNGVATFSNLSIDKAGNGYTLQAFSNGLAGVTSTPFNITPGVAHLVITVQPTNTPVSATMNPWVRVAAVDADGNTVTSFSDFVSLSIGTNPAGGTLLGGSARADAGVAFFNSIIFDTPGSGYTLVASATGFASATSVSFDITNFPTRLISNNGRLQAPQGQAIVPPVQFTVQDAQNQPVTSFNGAVSLSLGDNPFGGTLSGTTTRNAIAGVVTFPDVRIDRAGTYEILATSPGVTRGFISSVRITGPAVALVFPNTPSTTAAGAVITPPVVVIATDSFGGEVAKDFAGLVTISILNNPGGGTLSGTVTIAADTGVATFTNLSIDQTGVGYTFQATSPGLHQAPSPPFDIVAGNPPTQLVFTVEPTNVAAGTPIAPAVQVTAKDAQGNTAIGFTGDVTVSIGTNPSGGSLSGSSTQTANAGVATFSDLSIDNPGTSYTLQASASGLTTATSVAFNVTSLTDYWTTRAAMATARVLPGAETINGVLFVMGGYNGGDLSTMEAYNPALNTWSARASMPTGREGVGTGVINGILYVVGGISSGNRLATLEAYDPATDTWSTKASMSVPRAYLGTAVDNGILYAIGGNGGSGRDVEAYDPTTNSWATKASMPTSRAELGAVAINGTVYAVGGVHISTVLSTVEAYDPATDAWTPRASMPTARSGLGVVMTGDTLYAVGGFAGAGLATLEAYDPSTDTWTTRAAMLTARSSIGASAVGGLLYVIGGYDGNAPLATVEAYHP